MEDLNIKQMLLAARTIASEKNLFDIEGYMKRRGKAKLNKDTVITRV